MQRSWIPLLLLACLPVACSPKPAPPPRPPLEVVRAVRVEVEKIADARAAESEREGRRSVWRPRLQSCLEELDRIAETLEKNGAFGPPQDEQADELLRIGFELGQASECDARLALALRPEAQALARASKALRRFRVPG
jgi:hypothetical protein